MKYIFLLLAIVSVCNGCLYLSRNVDAPAPVKVWGSRPVYAADTLYRVIQYTNSAMPVVNAGKIYVRGDLIYQCEVGKGIHIIDNSDPSTAKRIAFLSVKGCEEIAIRNNFLYTNNYYDLVTIDISDVQHAYVAARNANAFFAASSVLHTWEMPPDSGYFECPQFYMDSVITGWVKDSVYQTCYK